MQEMFCFQCQQTAHNTGCDGKAGVCGKKADTANYQDEVIGALIGLAQAEQAGTATDRTDELMLKGLFTTITNVNFNNETILQNLLRLSSEFPQLPLHIRVPLIPGVNDSEENILATAEFCRRLTSCQTLEFLPYHRLGIATYQYTQRDYPMGELEALPVTDACSRVEFLCKQSWPFAIQVSGKTLS